MNGGLTEYKTVIGAVAAGLMAILGWLIGELPGQEMLIAVWGSVQLICLRIGIDINVGGFLAGFKTYIVGIIGILGSIVQWAVGNMDYQTAIGVIVSAIIAMLFRKAVKSILPGTPGNYARA